MDSEPKRPDKVGQLNTLKDQPNTKKGVASSATEARSRLSSDGDDQGRKGKRDAWDRTKIGLEIVGLATLILYTVFAGCQANTANDTLAEMQRTNRPYIFTVPTFSFVGPIPTTETVSAIPITVQIVNVGPSPAIHVISSDPVVALDSDPGAMDRVHACSVDYPTGEGVPVPPNQPFPQGGSGITTHTSTRTLTDGERKKIVVDKTSHLFVLGGIRYSGIKGGAFQTTYCYIWNPESLNGHTYAWAGGGKGCPCNAMN